MPQKQLNKTFKLQGKSFSSPEELIIYSEGFLPDISSFLKDWFDKNDFVVVKTSGSTGKPKEIHLKKEQMVNSAKATGTYFNLFENTSALLCMSSEFIAGKMMIVRALVLGWNLTIVEPSSNPLNNIETTFDFCAMVPLQVQNSLNYLDKVKKLIIGGGTISAELNHRLQDLNTECFATYGMTETITHIAVKKLNNFPSDIIRKTKQSHYFVLPNVKISQDSRNCLIITAPNVSDNDIITNDIINLKNEMEFEWLGRYDNIINSGGIKLFPEQIEEKLSTVIEGRFFVYGKPDKDLGDKLVLIVEGEEDEIIIKKISKLNSLLKYEIPKEIIFINDFIETETKKIDRNKTFLKFTAS